MLKVMLNVLRIVREEARKRKWLNAVKALITPVGLGQRRRLEMFGPEYLNILMQGVKIWNQWRDENPDIRPDFRGQYLSRLNIRLVNFSGTDLTNANLREAILMGADLTSAILTGANLTGMIFTGANLTGADL